MNIEQKKEEIRNRDRIIRIMTETGHFRAALIKNTKLAQTAQKRHNLSGVPASFLARTLSGASLIAAFLKGEERAILELMGSGVISKIFAEASQNGEVRGYVGFKDVERKYNVKSSEDVLGIGLLRVTRILYNEAEPVTGVIELRKSDVASDLEYYFTKSEQIDTAVLMDVVLDDNSQIIHSSAFMLQAMPGYSIQDLRTLYENLTQAPSLSELFDEYEDMEKVINRLIPFPHHTVTTMPVDFFCRCSKDNFVRALITLDIKEIKEMQESGQNELVCQYCNEHYELTEQDFEGIIEKITASKN